MKIFQKKQLIDIVINKVFLKIFEIFLKIFNKFILYLSTLNYIFTSKFQLKNDK